MRQRYVFGLIGLTLFYYLGAVFGLYLKVEYTGVTPIWPPSGIAVAVFLIKGKRYWPMILIGEFLVALTLHQPPLAGIIGGAAQLLEAAIAVELLKRKEIRNMTASPEAMLWFVSLGVLLPPLISSAIGATTLNLLGLLGNDSVLSGLITWWLGDAIGILVIAPLLVGIADQPRSMVKKFPSFIGYLTLLIIISAALIYCSDAKSNHMFFVMIPAVVIAGTYFRLIGAGSATLLLMVIVYVMRLDDLQQGEFITSIRMAFVGTCAFTGYLVTGFMEKEDCRRQVIERQNTYLNTLQELIQVVLSHLEMERLLNILVSHACTLVSAKDGYFLIVEGTEGRTLEGGKGIFAMGKGFELALKDQLAGQVKKENKAIMINDYDMRDDLLNDTGWDAVHGVIGMPVFIEDKIIGILVIVQMDASRKFATDDLRAMQRFGELAAIALKNSMMYTALADELAARRQAENALTISERTHREIFNSAGEAVCVLDAETGEVLQANRAAGLLLPMQTAGPGQSFFKLIAGQDPAYSEKAGMMLLTQNLETPKVVEWHSSTCQNGCWYEITFKSALIDDIPRVLAVARNIDDRKEAEYRLRQLQMAIDFAGDDILVTDEKGIITYVNPAFERTTQYSRSEVIGRKPNLLNSGVQDQRFYKSMWATLLSGEVWTGHLYNRRKDGAIILQDASIAPFRDSQGKIAGFITVRRDITEYEHMKNQLVQAQKMEAIGTLAGGIAHDFNNILGGIIGYAELALTKHLAPEHPAAKNLQEIVKAGNRAAELVKQILTFSRPREETLSVLDVRPVVKEVLKLLSASHPPTAQIKTRFDADTSLVLASPTHIYQLLMNLTTNAVQSLPNARGEVEIRLANIDFTTSLPAGLESLNTGKYLEIAVIDNGCGMNEEILRKVFDPYFSTKAPGKGTGLGMSMVHGIVKHLRGAITMESETGKGTAVHVFLPVMSDVEENKQESRNTLPSGNEKILLIDDNPQLVDIAEQMLHVLGYAVAVFTEGQNAIDAFKEHPDDFQLVVSDMLMPDITGIELCLAIKEVRPAVPVIICTGNPNNISHADMTRAKVSRVIQKPLKLEELALVVRSSLDNGTKSKDSVHYAEETQ